MSQIQLPIKNFPAQQTIFDAPQTYVVVPKGRRFGLTKGAANDFILKALQGKFKQGLWVDVINSNIEKYIKRYFEPSLKLLPPSLWSWKKDPHVVTIRDSFIDFRSADRPESIEGFGYDRAFLNEAGIILKNPYLWENAIKPMLWDFDCKTIIGGTPKGGGGIFEELYQRGKDPLQHDYLALTFTPFDNPHIKHERIRADMLKMPQRVIDQEIYAKFLEDTGIVFRGTRDIAICEPQEPKPDHMYVVGCDVAKLVDFTVMAVYDRMTNEQVFQMRFNQLDWPTIRSRIRQVSLKYNRALVMLDSTGAGEPTHDDLVRAGVPVTPIHFTNELKKQMIEKLANWIELKNLKMLQLEETIDEFNSFTYDISEKTDRIFYGAPVGFHDDIVIAHALACWSLNPLNMPKSAPRFSPLQLDYLQKVQGFDNNTDGEYGEYEDSDNNYPNPF